MSLFERVLPREGCAPEWAPDPNFGCFIIAFSLDGELQGTFHVSSLEVTRGGNFSEELVRQHQLQFDRGCLISVFRIGMKGQCAVQVNQAQLRVTSVEKIETRGLCVYKFDPEDYYEPFCLFFANGEPSLVVEGTRRDTNESFEVKITYLSPFKGD